MMRIRIKKSLKEVSTSTGMTGYSGTPLSSEKEVDEFNENEKELSRLNAADNWSSPEFRLVVPV